MLLFIKDINENSYLETVKLCYFGMKSQFLIDNSVKFFVKFVLCWEFFARTCTNLNTEIIFQFLVVFVL